jgi:hypothetical protein
MTRPSSLIRHCEHIVIYLAGMGQTAIAVAPGTWSPSIPLAPTVDAPTIHVEFRACFVLYLGLTPGLPGLLPDRSASPGRRAEWGPPAAGEPAGLRGVPLYLRCTSSVDPPLASILLANGLKSGRHPVAVELVTIERRHL